MSAAIKAIHVMKRELGLEENDYRALLVRVTGKDSLRAMSGGQLGQVLDDLRAKGAGQRRLKGPYAARLQALWIACWNLGVIESREDSALLAFIARQTGIERTEFLLDAKDASAVVEALKAMLGRAGVDWTVRRNEKAAWTQTNGYRIAGALFGAMQQADARFGRLADGTPITLLQWMAKQHTDLAPTTMGEVDWHPLMNALGTQLRRARRQSS